MNALSNIKKQTGSRGAEPVCSFEPAFNRWELIEAIPCAKMYINHMLVISAFQV